MSFSNVEMLQENLVTVNW